MTRRSVRALICVLFVAITAVPGSAARYDKAFTTLVSEALVHLYSVGKGSQGYAVGIAPPMSRIWRDGGPSLTWTSPIEIYLAKGETEVCQLAVIPISGSLSNVTVTTTALTAYGIQGGPTVTVGPIGYVASTVEGQAVAVPDILLPQRPFAVSSGKLQAIYIQVSTTADTAPGVYSGQVTIQPSGKAAERFLVHVNVWDFALPKQPPLAGWCSTLATDLLLKNKVESGWWDPPFDLNDTVTQPEWASAQSSVQAWFDVGHSFMMVRTPGCPQSGSFVGGAGSNVMPSYTTQQIDNMKTYWRGMASILDGMGKLESAGVGVWNQPDSSRYAYVSQICGWVHDANPRLKTVADGYDGLRAYRDSGDIDVFCPISSSFNPWTDRTDSPYGADTWSFLAGSPVAPYPNLMVSNAPLEQRIFGWQSWRFGNTGFAYWETHRAMWEGTTVNNPPSTDCGSIGDYGNGTLVYSIDGVYVPSLRLRHFADGLEDLQYIGLLNDLIDIVDRQHPCAECLEWRDARLQARAALGVVRNMTGATASSFANDSVALSNYRAQIAQAIVRMRGINTTPQGDCSPPSVPVVLSSGYILSTDQLRATWSSSDPLTGVAEYTYAIGTAPGASNVSGWTSVGTGTGVERSDLPLTVLNTYYFSVMAKDGNGFWSDIGTSDGVSVVPGFGLGNVHNNANNVAVSVPCGVVTAGTSQLASTFYVEAIDRSSGIKVYSGSVTADVGDLVSLTGTMSTQSGERTIINPVLTKHAAGRIVPAPLAVDGRNIGGSAPNSYTLGVDDSTGLYNVGLLITTFGRVTYANSTSKYFYVDDGSGRTDGSGRIGVKVTCLGLVAGNTISLPVAGVYVKVVGMVSTQLLSGRNIPVIRPRTSADVVQL